MQIYEDDEQIRERLLEIRRAQPKRRFLHLFYWLRNTSCVGQMACALCNASGPTWCYRWPKTQRAIGWERHHRAKHEEEVTDDDTSLS